MQATNLAQNEFVDQKIPGGRAQVASIATPAETAAGATFELRLELFPTEFQKIGLWDGVANAVAVSITGPNQYAWANVPGGQTARVVRTDGAGGNGSVGLDVRET
jgi:hypothetical protein